MYWLAKYQYTLAMWNSTYMYMYTFSLAFQGGNRKYIMAQCTGAA